MTEGIPSQASPLEEVRLRGAAPPEAAVRDIVTVRLPAAAAYLAVLRTTTASLAARLDFTLDEIGDLRIAVDEACCLLLAGAAPGAELNSVFEMSGDTISVTVSTQTISDRGPTRDSFAWTVLSALAGHVDSWTEADGTHAIALAKRREYGASA